MKMGFAVRGLLLCGCVLFMIVRAIPAFAQPDKTPAVSDEQRKAGLDVLSDAGRTDKERLAALQAIGYPGITVEPLLLQILQDPEREDELRWEAARLYPFTDDWVNATAAILTDPQNGGELLNSQLAEALRRRVVTTPPAEIRQTIQRVFRALLDDPRASVRQQAYWALVPENDQVAVKKLKDALQTPEQAPIPLDEAINLFYAAGATSHLETLRPFLDHGDEKVQIQAVRALAVDPQSRAKIRQIIQDTTAPSPVRVVGLEQLVRANAASGDLALSLLENEEEPADLRFASVRAFLKHMKRNRVSDDQQLRFARGVQSLSVGNLEAVPESRNANRSLEQLQSRLGEKYPTIKKYYDETRNPN